jgi:transposase, IS30 family
MQYQHFSVQEREEIQQGLWRGESIRAIAVRIKRSHTSVAREIKRNKPGRYSTHFAQERATKKRKSRGVTKLLKNTALRLYVIAHLKHRWSPEQIAGRMKKDKIDSIAPETIYQFIYAQIRNGATVRGGEDLRIYLRRRRKRRIPHGARRFQRVEKPLGRSIDARPAVVERRSRVGDWESDTVESRDHKPGINTLVDRKTGLVRITKLTDRTAKNTALAIDSALLGLPVHTITFDNGKENQAWKQIECTTGASCFFAHPYHSWERGTNENTNGLIRDYFPKRTDFTVVPAAEIAFVEYALNMRPRKRLGYRTPLEVWGGALTY